MFIYKIENLINSKCYIGQTTKDPSKRWKEHKISANSGDQRWLYSAMRKYGINNFKFSIVCVVFKEEDLDDLEQIIIAQEHSFGCGYNMTEGGKAFAHRGRSNTWFHKAVETCRSKGISFQRRTTKFEIIDKDNNIVIGENLTQFCKENNLSVGNLWETFYGRRKQHKGYKLIRTFND